MKFVSEGLDKFLKPKGVTDIIDIIKNLSVKEKIESIKKMESDWGNMYKNMLKNNDVFEHIKDDIKKELDKLSIIKKVDYIESLNKLLPDIFTDLKDSKTINELKNYILKQNFETKTNLIWKFFKSWPDLFTDIEDDMSIDKDTNLLLLLFKIKGAINDNKMDELQEFISELGEKHGRENIIDKAKDIIVSNPKGYNDNSLLFNNKDIEQLKLSLFKETRNEEEEIRDEYYDIYAFIGYDKFDEITIDDETFHKKNLGIENLVKLDKYDASSLSQVPLMKMRARAQSQHHKCYGVYIPKLTWDKDYAYDDDIPDSLRKEIDKNKFNF